MHVYVEKEIHLIFLLIRNFQEIGSLFSRFPGVSLFAGGVSLKGKVFFPLFLENFTEKLAF